MIYFLPLTSPLSMPFHLHQLFLTSSLHFNGKMSSLELCPWCKTTRISERFVECLNTRTRVIIIFEHFYFLHVLVTIWHSFLFNYVPISVLSYVMPPRYLGDLLMTMLKNMGNPHISITLISYYILGWHFIFLLPSRMQWLITTF